MSTLPRALLFPESVTLAHMARLLVLAQALRPQWQGALACAPAYSEFVPRSGLELLPLDSIAPAQFRTAVDRGMGFYTAATLRRYGADGLALIRAYQPADLLGYCAPTPLSRLCLSDLRRIVLCKYRALQKLTCSPQCVASYPLPVRQASALLRASFRFAVTHDTLAVS